MHLLCNASDTSEIFGRYSRNCFVNCISEIFHVNFRNFGKFAYVVVVVAVGLN